MSTDTDAGTLPIAPEEFLEIIASTTADVIVAIDASSTILFTNAAAHRVFGYLPEELLGQSLTLLMPEYLRRVHEQALQRYVESGTRHVDWTSVELPALHRDGHELTVEVSFGESLSNGRRVFTGIVRDISERKAVEEDLAEKVSALHATERELRDKTLHDALTGLPNRVLLMDRLEQVLRRRKGDPDLDAALLFLDFDRFKVVNDSLGHAVGDAMLVAIGDALRQVVRPEDTVARLGGDEFVILLDHVDAHDHSVELVERIERVLREPVDAGDHQIYTSASIGIIPSMFDYPDADAVLRDADTAMYQAKAMGRGRHQVFDQSMRDQAIATMNLENDLRRALDGNEFRVRYEPIHRLGTGELCGFEALVHWEHPRRGLLPPLDFLQAATELGIMREVDRWLWREASRSVAAWRARFGRPLLLSLNFSRQHFLSVEGERPLLDTLAEAGADVDQTIIALDEHALHRGSEGTRAVLQRLAERGVRLHLDDFGTNHASLYNLQHFHIDALKIDRSIVCEMMDDPKSEELVAVIVGLAGNLGLEVVAKGVAREAQRRHLEALTCAYAQGPLFAPPLEHDAAVRYVEERGGLDEA